MSGSVRGGRSGRGALVPCLVAAVLGLGAGLGAVVARPAEPPTPLLRSPLTDDPRSTILLRYDCESEVGRRDVTLFGDGTVRLRYRLSETETGQVAKDAGKDPSAPEGEMRLFGLDPDSLDAYRARLEEIDLSEVEVERNPVVGEWVERCTLDILQESAALGEHRFRFSRYSALPLELSRVVRVGEDLIAEVEERAGRGLPDDFAPRSGDVLERLDGVRFEVVDFTVDGKGVELRGVDAPLVLYLSPDALRKRFVRVISRGEPVETEP